MAAAAAAEVQALLRFLTQDAKLPLASALPKTASLRKAKLNTVDAIATANVEELKTIFQDEKLVKQVSNAAKRIVNPKKRQAESASSPPKRIKRERTELHQTSEADLRLPESTMCAEELAGIDIETNRAPLVLAFAVMLIQYTMPEQPLSSRLSLAQAVVSLNSQSKAKSIGLTADRTAEEDGWAQGQPKVKILGREVAVMRRALPPEQPDPAADVDDQSKIKQEDAGSVAHEAFWGLDLEALRRSNGPLLPGKHFGHPTLPIHNADAARNYLLKSFSRSPNPDESLLGEKQERKLAPVEKKPTSAEIVVAKEETTGMLLKSLDLLFESWSKKMSIEELDRKAWSWYVHVRPTVAQGQSGWGQKGVVHLGDILKFRKLP